jgi:hypothetical protein
MEDPRAVLDLCFWFLVARAAGPSLEKFNRSHPWADAKLGRQHPPKTTGLTSLQRGEVSRPVGRRQGCQDSGPDFPGGGISGAQVGAPTRPGAGTHPRQIPAGHLTQPWAQESPGEIPGEGVSRLWAPRPSAPPYPRHWLSRGGGPQAGASGGGRAASTGLRVHRAQVSGPGSEAVGAEIPSLSPGSAGASAPLPTGYRGRW